MPTTEAEVDHPSAAQAAERLVTGRYQPLLAHFEHAILNSKLAVEDRALLESALYHLLQSAQAKHGVELSAHELHVVQGAPPLFSRLRCIVEYAKKSKQPISPVYADTERLRRLDMQALDHAVKAWVESGRPCHALLAQLAPLTALAYRADVPDAPDAGCPLAPALVNGVSGGPEAAHLPVVRAHRIDMQEAPERRYDPATYPSAAAVVVGTKVKTPRGARGTPQTQRHRHVRRDRCADGMLLVVLLALLVCILLHQPLNPGHRLQ